MSDLFWLDVVSRIVHVLTAITLVGGAVFIAVVLHPVLQRLEAERREEVQPLVIGRWKWVVHFGILLFLLSGFFNYFRAMPLHQGDGLYHALVGTKILLAFWVMFLASALVGRSSRMASFRANRGLWSKVLVASAVVIVCISGFVKVRGSVGEPEEDATDATALHWESQRWESGWASLELGLLPKTVQV